MRSNLTFLGIISIVVACGHSSQPADAGPDAHVDAGWTQCSSPDGYRVCGATVSCPPCPDKNCYDAVARVGLCDGQPRGALLDHPCYAGARDGELCVAWDDVSGFFYSVPANIGRLLAQNGAAPRVRFGDMSQYSLDTTIPPASDCPVWAGTHACGGSCGPCDHGFECVARGPLHPVGFCKSVNDTGCKGTSAPDGGLLHTCNEPSKSCLALTVQPVVQRDADLWGSCIPTDTCNDLAAKFPGGAQCTR